MSTVATLLLSDIDVPRHHRAIDTEAVTRIAASVEMVGLQHPVTVRNDGRRYQLVAGRHRLEAFRSLGKERIPANVAKMTDDEARMWEISENLHRAELTDAERYEQLAEYAALAEKKNDDDEVSAHGGQKPQGGRPEGGDSLAARDLGVDRKLVQRAKNYAKLPEELKETAAAAEIGPAKLLRIIGKETTAEAKLVAVERERALRDAKKSNRQQNEAVALTEAQLFSDWLLARMDLNELPTLISWLEGCKPREVIAALRREAA